MPTRFKAKGEAIPSFAMRHADVPGAGARKRRRAYGRSPRSKKAKKAKQAKAGVVMGEYKCGTLHSGSGAKVTKRSQALAIAMSESGQARKKRRG